MESKCCDQIIVVLKLDFQVHILARVELAKFFNSFMYMHPVSPFCVLLSVVSLSLNAWGQPIHNSLRFDHITVDDGLSQDIVTSIAQDSLGFMWFGTENGLNRYDGYTIKVFKHNPRDSSSLPANDVGRLLVDARGVLWITTSMGICRHVPGSEIFDRVLGSEGAFNIVEVDGGRLLVGTPTGLVEIDARSNIATSAAGPLVGIKVNGLSKTGSGEVLIGAATGLFRYDPQTKRLRPDSSVGGSVASVLEDSHGYLWTVIDTHPTTRLLRVNITTRAITEYRSFPGDNASLPDPRIQCLYEDRRGDVWAGSFAGLEHYDPITDRFIHHLPDPDDSNSLLGSRVYTIIEDRDGTLWVGTYRGGVNRADPYNQRFEHYRLDLNTKVESSGLDVFAIMEDTRGDLWIGTDKSGVNLFDRKARRSRLMFSDRAWSVSVAIAEDSNGRVWIGTLGSGLMRFDPATNTVKEYRHDPANPLSIADNSIRALHVDGEGVLWIGLLDRGLDRYDARNTAFKHFRPDGKDGRAGIWHIQEDSRGSLWVGGATSGSGVYRFDKTSGTFTSFEQLVSSAPRIASARGVYFESDSIVWLGTWGGGLIRLNIIARTTTQFTELEGLTNDFIKGMLADGNGNLWISTERGLSRFDPTTSSFTNFSTRDGLQGHFFYSGSCWKGRDGRMYFGGANGFNAFHPDSIKRNPNMPPVVITRFSVLNTPLPLVRSSDGYESMSLSHNQDIFSFEFVALNFTAPARNQYAYMMEGFDEEWVQAGARRYASYTHLDPGSYTFRVKASNNDGVWNEQGVAVTITIAPPYWQTLWFRGLAFLLIASLLYGIYRYRTERLLDVERLRSRIAADLHDDVGSNLSSIAIASQLIGRKVYLPDNERHQLAEIGSTALRTAEMMKEIVWLLNPKNDLVDDLLLNMKAVANSLFQGISLTFTGPQERIIQKIDLEAKRNLFMMYKEILNNVVRHASASEVSIAVGWNRRTLSLIVKDNGKGFDVNAIFEGNGLRNLRSRCDHIGGKLNIVSNPSTGTTVSLEVEIT